jgi:hypothetical protein
VRQVFQRNPTLRAFGRLDQLFGDTMVDIARKASFFAGQLAQPALGRERAFLLEFLAQAAVALSCAISFMAVF